MTDITECQHDTDRCQECFSDPNVIARGYKRSMQPLGERTLFCNACYMYVRPDSDGCCPYHQRVIQTEEGPELYYDEFDQDGNAW